MPKGKSTIEQREIPTKLTVLLPDDTIERIDQMMKTALLGSRGRTIQALVDNLYDSKGDIQTILSVGQALALSSNTKMTNEQAMQVLLAMSIATGNIVQRINKFLAVAPLPTGAQPSKEPTGKAT